MTQPDGVVPSKQGHIFNLKLFCKERKLQKPTHLQLLQSEKLTLELPTSYHIPVTFTPYDQGPIGSCTANALCLAFKLQQPKITPPYEPSRLFLYYTTRDLSKSVGQDGAFLDDGFEALQKFGVCPESDWPYVVRQQNVKPTAKAYTSAKTHRITSWGVVAQNNLIKNIKQVLVSNRPIVFGILVYESFESDAVQQTGIVPLPNPNKEGLLGGHALCMLGYDDSKQAFLVANSWGSKWGTSQPGNPAFRGFCYIPYAYIANPNLCDECLFSNGVSFPPPPPPPPKPKPVPPPPKPKPAPPKPKPRPPPPKPKKRLPRPVRR